MVNAIFEFRELQRVYIPSCSDPEADDRPQLHRLCARTVGRPGPDQVAELKLRETGYGVSVAPDDEQALQQQTGPI